MLKGTPRSFQTTVATELKQIYPDVYVETEWRAIKNIPGLYFPRVDIAVGPFSTVRGGNCITEYNQLMDASKPFIESLLSGHCENVQNYRTHDEQIMQALQIPDFEELKTLNENARCLLAVEIENKVTRKHLLGGAVNAAALGRIGIVVGWTDDKVKALVRLQAYWDFLRIVRKNTFSSGNLVILKPEQLRKSIDLWQKSRDV